jgi:hypothetical protein
MVTCPKVLRLGSSEPGRSAGPSSLYRRANALAQGSIEGMALLRFWDGWPADRQTCEQTGKPNACFYV